MYNQAPQTTETARDTEMSKLLFGIREQNARLLDAINAIDSIGHRLKNTNVPTPEQKENAKLSDGIVFDINSELQLYYNLVNRLNGITEKLYNLI